jgi:uncharacterized protein (TIGR02001 family)
MSGKPTFGSAGRDPRGLEPSAEFPDDHKVVKSKRCGRPNHRDGKASAMKRHHFVLALGFVLSVLMVSGAAAEEEDEGLIPGDFSATVAITTDYVWRGLTQTDEGVALQASIDWEHDSGLYAGFWGSNVEFDDSTQIEIDVYGGYAGEIAGFSYDVGFTVYTYPGNDDDLDFGEIGASVGYDFGLASLSTGLYVDPEFMHAEELGDVTWVYWTGGASVPIPLETRGISGVALSANSGYYRFEEDVDYWHWDAGLGVNVLGFDLDFRYSDTDLSKAAGKDADARFIFTFARTF